MSSSVGMGLIAAGALANLSVGMLTAVTDDATGFIYAIEGATLRVNTASSTVNGVPISGAHTEPQPATPDALGSVIYIG